MNKTRFTSTREAPKDGVQGAARLFGAAVERATRWMPAHTALGQLLHLDFNRFGDLLAADEFLFGPVNAPFQPIPVRQTVPFEYQLRRDSPENRVRFDD